MTDAHRDFLRAYSGLIEAYLGGAGESALQRAYELSREAMARGLGVLDVLAVHRQAVERMLSAATEPSACLRIVQAGDTLLVESLSPFEMTHGAFREANAALRRMNEMLEEETKRIAHSVHDEAGQLLSSVRFALEVLAQDLHPDVRVRLGQVVALLDRIEDQVRRLSHELRPTLLDDLGLTPALEFLAEGVSERAGISISVEGGLAGRLPPPVETALYRIVQEALNNVCRHSGATRASIRLLRKDRTVQCRVGDNGGGFNTEDVLSKRNGHGLGLRGMRERLNPLGGTLKIESTPGHGTELFITIPTED